MTGIGAAAVAVVLTFHVSAPNLTAATTDIRHTSPHAVVVQPAILPKRTRFTGID